MRKNTRTILPVVVAFLMCVVLFACAKKVTVPDLSNVMVEDAKTALTDVGLIPAVEYAYSDTCAEGTVIETTPQSGEKVEPQTKVTLMVSKGPEYIDAVNSSVEWFITGENEDEWNLFKPYIHDGTLYIECLPRFSTDMSWKGDTVGFGVASVDETFASSVPLTVEYEQQENAANTEQDIWLLIPLEGLGDDRPTNVYTKLCAIVDGKEEDVRVNFTIAW